MYEIKYAFPSSGMAKQLGRHYSGAYYLLIDDILTNEPFSTLEEAKQVAESTGYFPSKYSMDVFKRKV